MPTPGCNDYALLPAEEAATAIDAYSRLVELTMQSNGEEWADTCLVKEAV